MRLTNVARMTLPAGRVGTLDVQAHPLPDADSLPISFDQARHVSAGDRPGSWMALSFRLRRAAPAPAIARAWEGVIARHGTLRTVFDVDEHGELRLRPADVVTGGWTEHPAPAHQLSRDVLRAALDARCRPFATPSHLLALIEPGGGADPTVVIAADHAHVDMWSLVILARDLADLIDDERAGGAPRGDRVPAPTFAEHSAELAARPSAPAVITRRWAEILDAENGQLPLFPLTLGDVSRVREEIVEVRDVLDPAGMTQFAAAAAVQGVRPVALAMSALTQVSLAMSGRPLRAVFPVHSRFDRAWHDAVGWFITNAVLECADPSPSACASAISEAIGLGSYPLGPILDPIGGMPNTPGMFAISWLDTSRLPVSTELLRDVQYVSAVIRTDGVMIWFIANETGLHLRCRYPDTPEARRNVGTWLDATVAALQGLISPPN